MRWKFDSQMVHGGKLWPWEVNDTGSECCPVARFCIAARFHSAIIVCAENCTIRIENINVGVRNEAFLSTKQNSSLHITVSSVSTAACQDSLLALVNRTTKFD